MRHCSGETVQIYEASSYGEKTLAELLREAADLVETTDHAYAMIHTGYDTEAGYIVTAYLS